MPLFRSSNVQLWPILGTITQFKKADDPANNPIMMSSFEEFLVNFVTEMQELISNGLI